MTLPALYGNPFFRKVYSPKLTTVFLELTNYCNLQCKMCNWRRGNNGYISKAFFESCLNQLSEMKLSTLNLQFGGESLLHPDFKELLTSAIHKRDSGNIKSVGLTTNGMLFNQEIADLFIALNVDWINFSLDGIGVVNDNIRLGSKYPVIEQNIKYIVTARGHRKKPQIFINVVDYAKSEEQKLDIYREWVNVVDEIELLPSIRADNTWEDKGLTMVAPPKFCLTPLNTMAISWDGKVTYCCFDSSLKVILGDATKVPIKQIWESSLYQNLRKNVIKNMVDAQSPCYRCEFWKVNFEPKNEIILDGTAQINYGYTYRRIKKIS